MGRLRDAVGRRPGSDSGLERSAAPAGERIPRRGRHDPHALLRVDEKVNRDDSSLRLRHTQLAGTSHRKNPEGAAKPPLLSIGIPSLGRAPFEE